MGYLETLCQLCGVSFAIARLRYHGEPPEAAWGCTGHGYVEQDSLGGSIEEMCGKDSGCSVTERESQYGRPGTSEEHIAGPGCPSGFGYSGYRISLKEMQGCRAIQCLAKKGADWTPEPSDQDFELESDYFLTGIGDGSPDMVSLENIQPVRHGIREIYVKNGDIDDDFGLPFHPTCFEIFKKISTHQLGKVDVEGLWRWQELEGWIEKDFVGFTCDFAVQNGCEQWWNHEPGTEYLAANPIEVPSLVFLLKGCKVYSDSRGVFNFLLTSPSDLYPAYSDNPPSGPPTTSDPFMAVPAELAQMILYECSSKDIANLRLASRAFRQLDHSVLRKRLLDDMPWLWEAHHLPIAKINWLNLYRKTKSCWGELKGLKNRKRIWNTVEEIVRRIDRQNSLADEDLSEESESQ